MSGLRLKTELKGTSVAANHRQHPRNKCASSAIALVCMTVRFADLFPREICLF
ncbi:rCG52389 [Rattus norvegicus]|uniref:RCG52389 n=1 Tax=Rattus norvegicus TaxID=10116 RepID=A6K0M7_RAT|nr:rCG52389 [Rattus norvegicus]